MTIPIRSYNQSFEGPRTLAALMPQPGLEWITELSREDARLASIVLHISCNANYTLFIPYIAQEILKKLDKSFVVFGGTESCCGSIQHNRGEYDLEEQNALLALRAFGRVKPQLLVSVCPDCDEIFDKFRPPATRFEIANISGLLPRFLEELKPLLGPVKRKVVIHHHASDKARVADGKNMRILLEAIPGLEIVESRHHLGPGVHCSTRKPMSAEARAAMFNEMIELGADTLVVPYHSCYRQYCKAQLEYPIEVQHYLGIVAESMGIEFDEPFKRILLLDSVDSAMQVLRPSIAKHGFDERVVRGYVERAVFI
jgi:Fe-S oxidoreductase